MKKSIFLIVAISSAVFFISNITNAAYEMSGSSSNGASALYGRLWDGVDSTPSCDAYVSALGNDYKTIFGDSKRTSGNGANLAAKGSVYLVAFHSKPNQPFGRKHTYSTLSSRIIVPAREIWTDTGIYVKKGFKYKIVANGRWVGCGNGRKNDANGCGQNPCSRWNNSVSMPSAECLSLVGKVGSNGAPFFVGTERIFRAERNGRLYLGPNDSVDGLFDNHGSLIVKIGIEEDAYSKPNQAFERKHTYSTLSSGILKGKFEDRNTGIKGEWLCGYYDTSQIKLHGVSMDQALDALTRWADDVDIMLGEKPAYSEIRELFRKRLLYLDTDEKGNPKYLYLDRGKSDYSLLPFKKINQAILICRVSSPNDRNQTKGWAVIRYYDIDTKYFDEGRVQVSGFNAILPRYWEEKNYPSSE